MIILDGRHLNVCVLVNRASSDIVAFENLSDGYRASTIGNSDVGANPVILYGRLDQRFGRRGTVDVDRACALVVPCDRHQGAKPRSVIVMVMGDENCPDIADNNACLCDTSRYPVASIDNIMHPVDGEQIGRLRLMSS